MITLKFEYLRPNDAKALIDLYRTLPGIHDDDPFVPMEHEEGFVPTVTVSEPDTDADGQPNPPEEEPRLAEPLATVKKTRKARSDRGASRTKAAAPQGSSPPESKPDAPVSGPADAAAPADEDHTVAALKALFAKRGFQAAMDLLSRYGCKRVGELLPNQYAEFIAECDTLMAVASK